MLITQGPHGGPILDPESFILTSLVKSDRYYCIKAVSYTINSHALTGENPCVNKGFHVLLMHGKVIFNMIVPGSLK